MDAAGTREAAREKKEEAAGRLAAARERHPWLDHAIRMQQHYSSVQGNALAGAVTYFGFLSFFPVLALAFAAVGWISAVYPEGRDQLVSALQSVFPGLVGGSDGIPISTFEEAAGTVAGVGAVALLYSGLGWLSGMRQAMMLTFERPMDARPNLVVGKLRDLAALVLIGLTLVASVAVAGVVSGLSDLILDLLGLASDLQWLLTLVAAVVGLLANVVLFFTIFKLLADPEIPGAATWRGALLGAVGFEVLKQLATLLLSSTKEQPAFQVFGIALVLVVWINYFARVLVYAASWAHTDPRARASRGEHGDADEGRPGSPAGPGSPVPPQARASAPPGRVRRGGGARLLGAVAVGGAAVAAYTRLRGRR